MGQGNRGTVNVITKIPKKNNFELNYTFQNINFQTNDQILSGNGTFLSKDRKMGISLFLITGQEDFMIITKINSPKYHSFKIHRLV